jgi:hypothetical protein
MQARPYPLESTVPSRQIEGICRLGLHFYSRILSCRRIEFDLVIKNRQHKRGSPKMCGFKSEVHV